MKNILVFILLNSSMLYGQDRGLISDALKSVSGLQDTSFTVDNGVVTIQGEAISLDAQRLAVSQVEKIEEVTKVVSQISQTTDLNSRLRPLWTKAQSLFQDAIAITPVVLIGILFLIFAWWLGHRIMRNEDRFKSVIKNSFLRGILKQSIRVALIFIAVLLTLELLGARSILGAILGAAGMIGLAVSFAFKDIIENYIAGILLSIRHPFKQRDHIEVDGIEGIVVGMTTRATLIKTFDGNNVTIPNSSVFKQKITNFSLYEERRFSIEVGIDPSCDPDLARSIGVEAVGSLEGCLDNPGPSAVTTGFGNSTIDITFFGWVDQSKHDFSQVRSRAIRKIKLALESKGIELPDPTYVIKNIQVDRGVSQEPQTNKDSLKEIPYSSQTNEVNQVSNLLSKEHLDENNILENH